MTNATENMAQTRALTDMAQALAAAPQPECGLQALARVLAARIGYRLFTVLVLDREAERSLRYFSSQPEAYPPGGAKPIRENSEFYATVVLGGKARICVDRAECARAFPDHELIHSLGCESAMNVPVRWDGQTIASLNLLHEAGWYRQDMLPELSGYAAMAVPVIQKIIHTTRP